MKALALGAVLGALATGCGDDDPQRTDSEAADVASPVAKPQRLRGDYVFQGQRRRVDVSIVPRKVIEPPIGQPADQFIAVPIRKGRSLKELRLTSIVDLWRFEARWPLGQRS